MRSLIVDNIIIDAPIKDILERLQITLTNGKLRDILDKGDNLLVTCPHHGNGQEHTPACNIYIGNDSNITYGYFRCFVCEEQGSFLKFVAECFDSSEEYAKNWLLKTFDGHIIEKQVFMDDPIDLNKLKTKNKTKVLDESVLEQYQSWHPYLQTRGITRETASRFKLRYDSKYRQIIFPYYNEKNQLTALLRRNIDTKTFYIPSEISKPVYGINQLSSGRYPVCVLTEGLIDCLLGNQYGIPTIATLGQPAEDQIKLINKLPITTIYLMFDNDDAGRKFNKFVHSKLSKRFLVYDVNIVGKKDIGELTKDEFWNFIEKAHQN